MSELLTDSERLEIVTELCPKYGHNRPCESAERAREELERLLGPAHRADLTADLILMRAVDRYTAGDLSVKDLYRCRVLAYYLVFAQGGEEWEKWGIAASVRPGNFDPNALDLDEMPDPAPPGPPWQSPH